MAYRTLPCHQQNLIDRQHNSDDHKVWHITHPCSGKALRHHHNRTKAEVAGHAPVACCINMHKATPVLPIKVRAT